jgi:molybdopterin-containing oxidoreductase family iron-sulfur binding subunit
MTKLTWDNAVHVSPRTAQRLNLENQHLVELRYRGRTVKGSVWITPGEPDDTVTIHLGYGRENAGVVGNGAGFDAYLIRTSDALWFGNNVELHPTGDTYPLATAQMHKSMEGRDLIISKPVEQYRNNPNFIQETHSEPKPEETLYPQWSYTGYNWGMSIDLTACVNCSACVIACQAENNIPVVGKEQQLLNREMHWLRVDVYYTGDWDHPSALYQPVPCMHCEDAPCEVVCPVQATLHSADGLNDMVYNRCVGTRFCSNNCPYKVRRFNFLLYSDWYTEQLKLQKNPDVTVRSRGVIEKCTYCVQRIREAEIRSQDQDRYIRDGEVKTACQQVCPTNAIIFGDMNNPVNHVARLKREKLNYSLLGELNTRPHTTYLAELRNPNPELAEKI